MQPPRTNKKTRAMRLVQGLGLQVPLAVVSKIGKLLNEPADDGSDDELPQHHVQDALSRYVSSVATPNGFLISHLDLPTVDGSEFRWPICNVFALLYFLASNYSNFGDFLQAHCANKTCHWAIWCDETTSGNKLRPDNRRKLFRVT